MKAIILVAGYATRLYPLTINKPKALLPINGKAIVDYIVEQVESIAAVDEIYVITNHKFADQFELWAKEHKCSKPIAVIDDGTTSEENRRGAIGDILYTIKQKNIDDDVMIIAGDNFFTYSLSDYYRFFMEKDSDCVCVKSYDNREMLRQFGIALLAPDSRVIDIEEKPENPKSNNVVYATYIYKKETVPLFGRYIEEGNKPDAPGHFVEWLHKKKPVYAYKFSEECYDIGTPESYAFVCGLFDNKK
ncbi:nucleotidyltransferase family protein [Lachnospiraceae bacterium NSJ-143]|nr:nucleotidyltransferase family protein [Lachnospiraceae bacterium NSJ-143]